MSRNRLMLPLANAVSNLLPGIRFALEGSQQTYAAWPVWKDSTTKIVKFAPLPKKKAVKIFHQARQFERQTRQPGKQDGALGRNGILALHAMLFDIINYATGRLDPAISTIARKAGISIASAKRGLANLKAAGVLGWVRRAGETRDEKGRFCLEQDTNAYGVIPPSQWLGFIENKPPQPHPTAWGATPPLPSVIEQAAEEMRHGARKTALAILESDATEAVALALAQFQRTVDAIPEKTARILYKNR